MKHFRKGFRQTISDRFDHDAVVVVMVDIILCRQFITSVPSRDRKRAKVILSPAVDRSNIVRQGTVILLPFALPLLTQGMEPSSFSAATFVRVNDDRIALRGSRPEPIDAFRGEQPTVDDLFQDRFPVGKRFCRLLAHDLVGQNLWVLPMKLPRHEKRRPVDVFRDLRQRNLFIAIVAGANGTRPRKRRFSDIDRIPIGSEAIGERFFVRDQRHLPIFEAGDECLLKFRVFRQVVISHVVADQLVDDAHAS